MTRAARPAARGRRVLSVGEGYASRLVRRVHGADCGVRNGEGWLWRGLCRLFFDSRKGENCTFHTNHKVPM